MKQDEQEAQEEQREAIDETHQIAHDGRGPRDGVPRLHDDPDAEHLLAGGAAAVERLEQGEVAPEHDEPDGHPDGLEPVHLSMTGGGYHDGEQPFHDEQQEDVDAGCCQSRTDPGELKLDDDVLGRLDGQQPRKLGGDRVSRTPHGTVILVSAATTGYSLPLGGRLATYQLRPMSVGEILD